LKPSSFLRRRESGGSCAPPDSSINGNNVHRERKYFIHISEYMTMQIFAIRAEFFLTVECLRVLFSPCGLKPQEFFRMLKHWPSQSDLCNVSEFPRRDATPALIAVDLGTGVRACANPPN